MKKKHPAIYNSLIKKSIILIFFLLLQGHFLYAEQDIGVTDTETPFIIDINTPTNITEGNAANLIVSITDNVDIATVMFNINEIDYLMYSTDNLNEYATIINTTELGLVNNSYIYSISAEDSSSNVVTNFYVLNIEDNPYLYLESDVTGSSGESLNSTVNIIEQSESDTSSLTDNDPLVNLPSSSTSVTLGDTLTIQATISGTSPINQVVVSFETVDYNMTQLGDSDTYEVTLDVAQLPQDLGVYAYSVIAIDENGNIGSSASTLEVEPYFFTEVLDWLTFWN